MALVPFPGPQSGAYPVPPPEDDDDSPAIGKMSFLEHLDELRKRIVNSAIAIGVCVVVGFAFINRIVDFILAPTRKALPAGVKLIYTEPGEAFSLYVQIALIMGVVLAAPFIMYQVWKFIAPRFLLANFKYAFLIIFIAAAVITPTGDMMTQTIFAAPMVALYILSIVIAWVVGPKRLRAPADEIS